MQTLTGPGHYTSSQSLSLMARYNFKLWAKVLCIHQMYIRFLHNVQCMEEIERSHYLVPCTNECGVVHGNGEGAGFSLKLAVLIQFKTAVDAHCGRREKIIRNSLVVGP